MTLVKQRPDYTFKYNRTLDRHGWLRLTPAYSVKLVEELVQQTKLERQNDVFILDPFSGTATTGLVAAQTGFPAHLYDINPFLIWLGNAKCANYSQGKRSEGYQDLRVLLLRASSYGAKK